MAAKKKPARTFDVECYQNFFLLIIRDIASGRVWRWEIFNGERKGHYSIEDLIDLMESSTMVSFNGLNYDHALVQGFAAEFTNEQLYELSQYMINTEMAAWNYDNHFDVTYIDYTHIDIYGVAPLMASLKIYGGRIHSRKLQDLPVPWDQPISAEERSILIDYCINDNVVTKSLFVDLREKLLLRRNLSKIYGLDLLSKSDAQIAEGVIKKEMWKRGVEARSKQLRVKDSYTYEAPDYIEFKDARFKEMLAIVTGTKYVLSAKGSVVLPPEVRKAVEYKGKKYQFGIGGLHSKEKNIHYDGSEGYIYADYDVTSYYPSIILTNRYYPETLTDLFLDAYQDIVDRRIKAKREGDKTTSESLKIVINSSFGKFGNRYSSMYDPKLLIQTTITGQLSLLMLVEMFEREGIEVISANTDGVMIKLLDNEVDKAWADSVAREWERKTAMFLEDEWYTGVYKESVNSYFAVGVDGKVKRKGSTWKKPDLSKNPNCQVCADAVIEYVTNGTPVEKTIRATKDIRDFVVLKKVKAGAVYEGQEVGACVRWYYGEGKVEPIRYASNGNKVSLSEGATLVNKLPTKFPNDVNYNKYIERCLGMLSDLGMEYL